MRSAGKAIRLGIAAFVAVSVLSAFLVATAELALRWRNDLVLRRPKCSRPDPKELLTLAENCHAWEDSPRGPFRFDTNEDGFRDRPREFFRDGAVLLVGDSHVEGFRLPVEQGLARRLEEKLDRKVLNVGMEGTGPGQEEIRALRALQRYRAKAVVWALNPTDTSDEVYFQAVSHGEPNPLGGPGSVHGLLPWLDTITHGRSRLVRKLVEVFLLQRPYSRFMEERKFDPAVHCASLRELDGELRKRGVPLFFVLQGQGPRGADNRYRGFPLRPEEFRALEGCVRATGRSVVDVVGDFPDPSDYWPGDWHFTPEGTEKVADRIAAKLRAADPATFGSAR